MLVGGGEVLPVAATIGRHQNTVPCRLSSIVFPRHVSFVVLVMDEEHSPLRFKMAASSASTGVVPAIFAAKGAPSVPGQRHVAGMGRRQNGVLMEAIPRPRRCQALCQDTRRAPKV